MSTHLKRGKTKADDTQIAKYNETHYLIATILDSAKKKGKFRINSSYVKEELNRKKINPCPSKQTICNHLNGFVTEGKIRKMAREYRLFGGDTVSNPFFSDLKEIVDKACEGHLSGMIENVNRGEIVYYEFCVNKNTPLKKWGGLTANTIPPILNIFKNSVLNWKMDPKDLPDKVLIAYVINTKKALSAH